jgi:hypothetical protein
VVDEPIAQVVERLKNGGVIVDGPVVEDGGLALAFLTDPDGNPLYLAETANWLELTAVSASGMPVRSIGAIAERGWFRTDVTL